MERFINIKRTIFGTKGFNFYWLDYKIDTNKGIKNFFIYKASKMVGVYSIETYKEGVEFLFNFGILEEYRNQGIGKESLLYIIDDSRKRGNKKIELRVRGNNRKAVNLYKGLGFEIEKG